jgi:hypothetical protein
MAQKVRKVDFKDGVYLDGTVKQSVGVRGNTAGVRSLSGLTLVDDIEANATGVRIVMNGRIFIVPWSSITSAEIFPEAVDPLVDASLAQREAAKGKRG